ncbi:MAG: hypothetical protein U9R16_09770 [Campylobacterota bacterium]|nr:hypothetical protein [Campylobacterota bacterium]
MVINKNFLKITDDIRDLKLDGIINNLSFYDYHSKYLKKLQKTDIDKEDVHYISTYSSFIGEVYENVIYELLLSYAIKNSDITKFVLKGPHQDNYQNLKNGLMIDINNQIVYKAGYKDVTEFDALFFTKDSVCFVESTIVKTTTSLRKRLKKKKALLELLFPKLKIKALIILSQGAMGVNVFPSYCTVWVTKPFNNDKLIYELIHNKTTKNKIFDTPKNKKLIHTKDIHVAMFKYFDTLNWILRNIRKNKKNIVDFKFLSTEKISRYFEIYSKFYVGHINIDTFVRLLKHSNISSISEEIPLEKIQDKQIIVTIERSTDSFVFVYYLKIIGDKLKRLDFKDNQLAVSNKDHKGFTAAETKYVKFLFEKSYKLTLEDIIHIENLKQNLPIE